MRRLAGPNAITKTPIRDLADLQRRLPELEADMRQVIASDSSLGPQVADALVAAIRSGKVTAGKLGKGDNFLWMSYRPKGVLGKIQPPCAQLSKEYEAFEIAVEIVPQATAQQDARCALSVTRNCEHENPTITLDATGSSANARVERAGQAVPGAGPRWTVADTMPYSEDATFVVRAQGSAPPAQAARVFHFLIPKVCGNLTYMGESPGRTVAAAGTAATCDKSVSSPQCKPWAEVSVEPQTVEVHHAATIRTAGGYHDGLAKLEISCSDQPVPEVIDNPQREHPYTPGQVCCDDEGYKIRFETKNAAGDVAEATTTLLVTPHDWTFRPALAYYMPMDGKQKRDIDLPFGVAGHEEFEVDEGLGISLALEHRLNDRWGIEGAAIFGQTETTYELTSNGVSGEASHNVKFYALTVGPNLHLLQCAPADLYVGLFVGYGGLADPNYWVNDHHFHASFDGEFIWGAQIGLDVPFKPTSDWGFHGGLRYFTLSQETDAGDIDIDPLILELGLSYKF